MSYFLRFFLSYKLTWSFSPFFSLILSRLLHLLSYFLFLSLSFCFISRQSYLISPFLLLHPSFPLQFQSYFLIFISLLIYSSENKITNIPERQVKKYKQQKQDASRGRGDARRHTLRCKFTRSYRLLALRHTPLVQGPNWDRAAK